MTLLLLKIIFSSHPNKLSNVLITDNEIIGFVKLVEVVAISIVVYIMKIYRKKGQFLTAFMTGSFIGTS